MADGISEQEFVLRVVERCLAERITSSEAQYQALQEQLPSRVKDWVKFARIAYRRTQEFMAGATPPPSDQP